MREPRRRIASDSPRWSSVLARLAVAVPGWLLSAVTLGFLVGCASPHGMAAFIAASVVLGALGACCHAALIITGQRMRNSVGAVCGLATFPVTTLVLERRLFFPHDLYQGVLLVYLVAAGAGIAWLLPRIARASGVNGDEASR